ncbi:hypothetical protein ACEV90_13375 [Vibrio parahaemolyticus]|uniref:hypothetical protein n=1 Tax=unclassified Vibrio TaxID=2614977 RepID=UPI000D65E88F|nr:MULTISPECIES: hypothetical protein [unclassified Vibrio]EJO9909268.1 hypothetical protein [Vibrio parahaemolyticus]PWF74641.1 hypothetical protein CBX98_03035 [Vibrio sp. T9]USD75026.1 hypothetical protein J4N43_04890 [Vibrio sp. SCSIO 43009]
MSVNAQNFNTLVKQSLSSATTEIEFRNIISRSYYGMYHGVLEILTCDPVPIQGVGCHESLKHYLVSYDAKQNEPYDKNDLRRLKTFLEIYKTLRKKADYNLDESFSSTQAKSTADSLDKFLVQCSKMQASVTPNSQSKNP